MRPDPDTAVLRLASFHAARSFVHHGHPRSRKCAMALRACPQGKNRRELEGIVDRIFSNRFAGLYIALRQQGGTGLSRYSPFNAEAASHLQTLRCTDCGQCNGSRRRHSHPGLWIRAFGRATYRSLEELTVPDRFAMNQNHPHRNRHLRPHRGRCLEILGRTGRAQPAQFQGSAGRSRPVAIVRALGIVKRAAAETNMALGLLDPKLGETIVKAAQEVIDRPARRPFPALGVADRLGHPVQHERQ